MPPLPPPPAGLPRGGGGATPPRQSGRFRGRCLRQVSPGTDRVLRRVATEVSSRAMAPPTEPCNPSPASSGGSTGFHDSATERGEDSLTPVASSPALWREGKCDDDEAEAEDRLSPGLGGPDRSPAQHLRDSCHAGEGVPDSGTRSTRTDSGQWDESGMSGLLSTAASGVSPGAELEGAAQRTPQPVRWTPPKPAVDESQFRTAVRLEGAMGALGPVRAPRVVQRPVVSRGQPSPAPQAASTATRGPIRISPVAAATPGAAAARGRAPASAAETPGTLCTPTGAADRTPVAGMAGKVSIDQAMEWVRLGHVRPVQEAVSKRALAGGVNAVDCRGDTLLMEACRQGNADLAQWLVLHGQAALNVQNSLGDTALHLCFTAGTDVSPGPMGGRYGRGGVFSGASALSQKGVKLAQWLQRMGADTKLVNDAGKTALSALMR